MEAKVIRDPSVKYHQAKNGPLVAAALFLSLTRFLVPHWITISCVSPYCSSCSFSRSDPSLEASTPDLPLSLPDQSHHHQVYVGGVAVGWGSLWGLWWRSAVRRGTVAQSGSVT